MARGFRWPFKSRGRRWGGGGLWSLFRIFSGLFGSGGKKQLSQKQIRAIKAKEKKQF